MKRFWREMPALLFLLATFGIALWVLTDDRDAIPLHFNIRGEVDSWGEAWIVVRLPLIALALYGLLTLLQHRPQWCNYPGKLIDKERAYRQMSHIVCRIKTLVLCLMLYITLCVAQVVDSNIFVVLAIVAAIIFVTITGWSRIDTEP